MRGLFNHVIVFSLIVVCLKSVACDTPKTEGESEPADSAPEQLPADLVHSAPATAATT